MRRFKSLLGAIALTLTVVCAAAGCGGRAVTGGGPPHVITVPDRAQRTTPLHTVQQASINVPNLSWLSFYDGAIWVKRDDGFIVRIDPRTDKQTGKLGAFTGQQHYCQGIGAGGGAVWSCQGSNITRIDPERMKIVATIPVGKVFGQGRLVFTDRRIWVIAGRTGNQLVGIDTATNRPDPAITLPYGCSDLAPGGDALWVLCPDAGRVVKIDVARRSIDGSLALGHAYDGYATATNLWVGSDQGLVRVNATTLKPEAIFQNLDPGYFGDVAVDGNHVWVRTKDQFLHLIDATSNTVSEHITASPALGGGALLTATNSIWTTADDAGELLRLRPQ